MIELSLDSDVDDFVQEVIASGRYPDFQSVIRKAFSLFVYIERQKQSIREDMQKALLETNTTGWTSLSEVLQHATELFGREKFFYKCNFNCELSPQSCRELIGIISAKLGGFATGFDAEKFFRELFEVFSSSIENTHTRHVLGNFLPSPYKCAIVSHTNLMFIVKSQGTKIFVLRIMNLEYQIPLALYFEQQASL